MQPQQNKFVLVVEDDVDLCNSMQGALQSVGFKTIGANSLRDGLAKIRNQSFVCILLDIRLGDESGEELIEQARDREESLNRATPLIVISGYLERDLVKRLVGRIDGAMVKPFEKSGLISAVLKATGGQP